MAGPKFAFTVLYLLGQHKTAPHFLRVLKRGLKGQTYSENDVIVCREEASFLLWTKEGRMHNRKNPHGQKTKSELIARIRILI